LADPTVLPRRRVKGFGWKRDTPSINDRLFADRPRPHGPLPDEIDLRPDAPAVRDQGQLGSCTGFGCTGALMYLRKAQGCPDHALSPLFVYYNERVIEATVDSDSGAQIRDGNTVLKKLGVPREELWPYDVDRFAEKPPQDAYDEALSDQVVKSWRVDVNPDQVMAALAQKLPVVIGISVYASFESDKVAKDGMVPMPRRGERLEGGHCIWACGYNKTHRLLICQNSWGNWADGGYFYLPFDYLDRRLAADFWALEMVENDMKSTA
jgi:C1A family cysteine protease